MSEKPQSPPDPREKACHRDFSHKCLGPDCTLFVPMTITNTVTKETTQSGICADMLVAQRMMEQSQAIQGYLNWLQNQHVSPVRGILQFPGGKPS